MNKQTSVEAGNFVLTVQHHDFGVPMSVQCRGDGQDQAHATFSVFLSAAQARAFAAEMIAHADEWERLYGTPDANQEAA